ANRRDQRRAESANPAEQRKSPQRAFQQPPALDNGQRQRHPGQLSREVFRTPLEAPAREPHSTPLVSSVTGANRGRRRFMASASFTPINNPKSRSRRSKMARFARSWSLETVIPGGELSTHNPYRSSSFA